MGATTMKVWVRPDSRIPVRLPVPVSRPWKERPLNPDKLNYVKLDSAIREAKAWNVHLGLDRKTAEYMVGVRPRPASGVFLLVWVSR